MVIVEMKNVSKTIKIGEKKNEILRNIDLFIKSGEFVSVMGPSGSGKSTLLNILGGLDLNYSGEVYIGSKKLSNMKEKELIKYRSHHIGIIFQEFNLIPTMNIKNNLMLPLIFQDNIRNAAERMDRVLDWVHMSGRKEELCEHLSGGEKQRIAIARAVIAEPDIILADEPTGALDSTNGKAVMDLLKNCNQKMNTTILLVTHDKSWAEYGDRLIQIQDGCLI